MYCYRLNNQQYIKSQNYLDLHLLNTSNDLRLNSTCCFSNTTFVAALWANTSFTFTWDLYLRYCCSGSEPDAPSSARPSVPSSHPQLQTGICIKHDTCQCSCMKAGQSKLAEREPEMLIHIWTTLFYLFQNIYYKNLCLWVLM